MYDKALVWLGVWKTPDGLYLNGFHVWSRAGKWAGVYRTQKRAQVEAHNG